MRRRPILVLPVGLVPSRARFSDVVAEASSAVARRRARSILTSLGTVLGVGAFVATIGLAATAGAQISGSFDVLKATEVRLEDGHPDSRQPLPIPDDTDQRLARLNGVVAAGRYWNVMVGSAPTAHPGRVGSALDPVAVIAASPGALAASRPALAAGRIYDGFHERSATRVAVVGSRAAERLGINRVLGSPVVFIDGAPFSVIGIIDDVERNADLLLAVIVPDTTALATWGTAAVDGASRVIIDVQPGAAELIGRQAAIALRPQQPERLLTVVPPEPRNLRRTVEHDSNGLYLALSGVTLLIGCVGIANTTLVSVMERTGEIGLRRALGARRRHIAAQFLTESAILGTAGGLVGTIIGLLSTAGVSAARDWTATIPTVVPVVAPLLGTMVGVAAGVYPALKASSIEPLHALRAHD